MRDGVTVAQSFESDTAPDGGVSPGFDAAYPHVYWESDARAAELPPVPWRIPGILPLGLTVCAASPKLGKSFLGQQIEHHLSAGMPLFGQVKERLVPSLVIDMEGNYRRTGMRSRVVAPDADAGDFAMIRYVHAADKAIRGLPALRDVPAGLERIGWLASYLEAALEGGYRFEHVRIDTYRAFLGSRPREMNAYDWDERMSRELDALAHRWQISILAMHHTNRREDSDDWLDRVSGSMGVAGGATAAWLLERARGGLEGVLWGVMRDGEDLSLPVVFDAGVWRLQNARVTACQARRQPGSCPRAVVDVLTQLGPQPLADLVAAIDFGRDTIRRTLGRLSDDGDVISVDGLWRLTQAPALPGVGEDADSGSGPSGAGSALPTPDSEREPTPALAPTDAVQPVGAPRETGAAGAPDVQEGHAGRGQRSGSSTSRDTGANRAVDALEQAILASRGHPVPNIAKELRTAPPWSVVTGLETGRHRWINPAAGTYAGDDPGQYDAVVLDRNGAYPSAMGNVAVAPNVLAKGDAGVVSELAGLAGAALVEPPADWPADRPPIMPMEEGPVWVPAPIWEQLLKLDYDAKVHESWVGRRSTALFTGFVGWVRAGRKEARELGQADYDRFKRQVSIAIRVLYPIDESKGGRFWRPDWHAAILAEANVRHWAIAQKCEAPVLALHHTDEVVVAVPRSAPDDFLPKPYKLGLSGEFGHVTIEARMPVADWIANGYTHRERGTRGNAQG